MKKMSLAEGSLVLTGFLLLLAGGIVQLLDVNLLPVIETSAGFFTAANTCFILAITLAFFDVK